MSDSMSGYAFDWGELAFGSKKPLNTLKATFIMAPRELSAARFTQLVKQYLPQGNIILGLAKEEYIDGFAGQPQFRTLKLEAAAGIIDKVNASSSPHKIYSLRYFQRETDFIINTLKLKRLVAVNGSWQYAFHNRSTYYALVNAGLPFDMVSPFADEAEAKLFQAQQGPDILKAAGLPKPHQASYSAAEMLDIAAKAARLSYDYSFQTGAALGQPTGQGGDYTLLAYAYNKVVPYQTYAMHHGAARETNFSPPHDLNHYDTVHAEVELVIKAGQESINLQDTTIFINLLPCPTCARMLADTTIKELVYREDHSNGYAIKMLEAAGKIVRRIL